MILLTVAYDTTNPDQLPELMVAPDYLHAIVGKLITRWSTMELEAELLTAALLLALNRTSQKWQKGPFNKRWSLMLTLFSEFAGTENGLQKEMNEADRLMKLGKPVRDGLAHRRMMFDWNLRGEIVVRFEIGNRQFPWSKAYTTDDLNAASTAISHAAARLFRLNTPDHPTCLNLAGVAHLKKLPDMSHMRGG